MADSPGLFSSLRLSQLEGRRRLIAALVAICIVISLGVVFALSRKPAYSTLYSDLTETDAAAIVGKLKEAGTPYTLSPDGTTIQVPQAAVAEIKLTLAAEGFPQGGGVGYEIFDKSNFGQTDFTQRINYLRALQGELERMIRGLSPVQNARVILQIPEDSLYLDEQSNPPTASVVVKLRLGARFTQAEVRGIKRLVANGVAGMESANVTVVDVTGKILADGLAPSEAVPDAAADLQTLQERRLRGNIEAMLEKVLGKGRAVVRVTVEMDRDSIERKSEVFQPLAGTRVGVIKNRSEAIQGSSAGGPGGGVGLTANDGGTAAAGLGTADTVGTAGTSETVTNYEVSKQEETLVRGPGGIKRISVSVFVDGVDALRMASIRQIISSAAGIDVGRGDLVVVESMEFSPSDAVIASTPRTARPVTKPASAVPWAYVGAAAGGVLALVIVVTALRGRKRKGRGLPARSGVAEQAAAVDPVVEPIAAKPTPFGVPADRDDGVYEAIEEQIKTDPLAAALIIRAWLAEED